MIEVALFPIPNVVAFPGVNLPLHVFEPRYRKLIHDCVDQTRLVGVSHVHKTIHEPPPNQTLDEALSSNQATYKPREVFSAGNCEIIETTDDGRIIAVVRINQRLVLRDEIQSLPYRIVSCEPLEDHPEAVDSEETRTLQESITEKLIELVDSKDADVIRTLQDPAWRSLAPGDFSFRIFQFVRFEADFMQEILEAQTATARLRLTWDLLRHA